MLAKPSAVFLSGIHIAPPLLMRMSSFLSSAIQSNIRSICNENNITDTLLH